MWIENELERIVERYGNYEEYAEQMWQQYREKNNLPDSADKYPYITGIQNAMLWTCLYAIKEALEVIKNKEY